ncbi:MAG TPA: hypothetical protein VEK79_14355 [Thermoanaerobaculia bacterium]|nr:hypothetical protein [Thermoanaerobaculia bacterium]
MGVFTRLREQRRLSGCIVAALLILGALTGAHHHRLHVPAEALAFSAYEPLDSASRSTECVVCRAADPARVEIARLSVPRVLVVTIADATLTERAVVASFSPSSPRAPPAALL